MRARSTDHPAYARMLAESRRTGLPGSFNSDLTFHDRRALASMEPGQAFAWFLYDCGTHLYRTSQQTRERDLHTLTAVVAHCCGERSGYAYVWNGSGLRAVTAQDSEELTMAIARLLYEPSPRCCECRRPFAARHPDDWHGRTLCDECAGDPESDPEPYWRP